MIRCGLRPGEAYALKPTDVDLENKTIHVEASLPVGPDNLWRRVGPLVGGAQGRDRSCRRALAGPLRLSRPALDSGVSRARVVGSGGSRCRAPVCLIRQTIAMVGYGLSRPVARERWRSPGCGATGICTFLWGAPHNNAIHGLESAAHGRNPHVVRASARAAQLARVALLLKV